MNKNRLGKLEQELKQNKDELENIYDISDTLCRKIDKIMINEVCPYLLTS